MRKELKYLFYVITILSFIIFVGNYYFSDQNKKNSYRSIISYEDKISNQNNDLIILSNNTSNIIEYVEQSNNKKKKKFNFWKLLESNE